MTPGNVEPERHLCCPEALTYLQPSKLAVHDAFDLSGYPLDQNLYQAVKGMSAAHKIVKQGGSILFASECLAEPRELCRDFANEKQSAGDPGIDP
jgi:nickel-dependent lactate racemase